MSLPTCACGHEYFRHGDSARLWLNLGVGAGKCKECDCKKWASPKNATANSMSLPPPRSSTPSGSPSESQSGSQSSTPSENQNSSRPDKPFVGFRGWRIDPRGLLPVVHYEKGPWALREPTRATCLVTEKHHAAEPNCQCGLWAMWNLARVPYYGPGYVAGAILGWGRVQRHGDEGFRAEHAQVIALALHVPSPRISVALTFSFEGAIEHLTEIRRLAELMDVPVMRPNELESFARPYGITYGALVSA